MSEGSSTPEQSTKSLRRFIDRAKQIKQIRQRGNKDAVLRTAIEKAKEEGEIDELTQLPNRAGYERRIKEEASRLQRSEGNSTLMLVDLDKLKQVNDSQGHPAGDEYIKRAAQVLRNSVRESDYVARIGGDEFAMILPETDKDSVWQVWDRIKLQAEENKVKLSAGFESINPNNLEETYKKADESLYSAKKDTHRNNVHVAVKEALKTNG